MAVTITPDEAAVAVRAAASADAVDPSVATVIGYLFKAAAAMIAERAPDAPDDIHNGAQIRLLGWLYDSDPADPQVGQALRVSGADALLAPWRVHRAGAIGTAAASPAPGPTPAPGAGLPPLPAQGHFILAVNNGELEWLAFPAP